MDYPALFQPKWNAKKFMLCNLVALALLLFQLALRLGGRRNVSLIR